MARKKAGTINAAPVEEKTSAINAPDTAVKAEEVKTTTEEIKAEAIEEAKVGSIAEKKAEKPVSQKKAAKPKKEAVAKPAKKAAPKTRDTAKKDAEKPESVEIQFTAANYSPEEIIEKCKAAYKNGGRKVIRTIKVYVNAAEAKAYYVVNGKNTDENGNTYSIDL